MRIIDKNKDYYDFLQNIWRDDSITFDRRDSYDLPREEFARAFAGNASASRLPKSYLKKLLDYGKHRFVLLQVCNSFWLFDMLITETTQMGLGMWGCKDYELRLNDKWKDCDRPAELIRLSEIRPQYPHRYYMEGKKNFNEFVRRGEYEVAKVFDQFTIIKSDGNGFERDVRHIPILKNIGIASEVPPEDIFLAFEEYFSAQKSRMERTESIGLTDLEKVTNHGFDAKTSFRGR